MHTQKIHNPLFHIDPFNRWRFVEASMILRGLGLDNFDIWREWAAPLNLPDVITQLWQKSEGTQCADPVAALWGIANRQGDR
ncbi:MAG: hypothetical protein LBQ81_12755 [Zoogloeaceae bacterium]|jgi:hypothetical protein|nr:hypothetical protein [Zoogloeaceae bacterium]